MRFIIHVYFNKIIRNEALDTLKKEKKSEECIPESMEHVLTPESIDSDQVDHKILEVLLEKSLGETKYEILKMAHQGFSLQEIADSMSMTLSNVKYHKIDAEKRAHIALSAKRN